MLSSARDRPPHASGKSSQAKSNAHVLLRARGAIPGLASRKLGGQQEGATEAKTVAPILSSPEHPPAGGRGESSGGNNGAGLSSRGLSCYSGSVRHTVRPWPEQTPQSSRKGSWEGPLGQGWGCLTPPRKHGTGLYPPEIRAALPKEASSSAVLQGGRSRGSVTSRQPLEPLPCQHACWVATTRERAHPELCPVPRLATGCPFPSGCEGVWPALRSPVSPVTQARLPQALLRHQSTAL